MSSDEPHSTGLTHVPISTDDPVPPDEDASTSDWNSYRKKLKEYSDELITVYIADKSISGELLWSDMTTMFSHSGIENLSGSMLTQWRSLLQERGVYVRSGKGVKRVDALIECISCDTCPTTTNSPNDPSKAPIHVSHEKDVINVTTNPKIQPPYQPPSRKTETVQDSINERGEETDALPIQEWKRSEEKRGGDGNSGGFSSMGLSGLSKLCQNRVRYSGALDEDLIGTIRIYKTLATTCGLEKSDMARGLPMLLDGDAMAYYSQHLSGEQNFEKVLKALQDEFISEEQRNRLLRIWQRTSLLDSMKNSPEKSEVAVFKEMCRLLSTTQRQLDEAYHDDLFLRDQIVIATDVPEVERSLREKAAKTSYEATQRIANLLSNEPRSAGMKTRGNDRAFYGLGKRFGGQARRPPAKTKNRKFNNEKDTTRCGCVVCNEDHFARNHHTQDEIVAAIRKRRRHPPKHCIRKSLPSCPWKTVPNRTIQTRRVR